MGGRGFLSFRDMKPKVGFKPIELEVTTSGKDKDLDAIAIYSNSFEFVTLSPHASTAAQRATSATRPRRRGFRRGSDTDWSLGGRSGAALPQ